MIPMPMITAEIIAEQQDLPRSSLHRQIQRLMTAVAAVRDDPRLRRKPVRLVRVQRTDVDRMPTELYRRILASRDLQPLKLLGLSVLAPPSEIGRVEHVGPRRQHERIVDDDHPHLIAEQRDVITTHRKSAGNDRAGLAGPIRQRVTPRIREVRHRHAHPSGQSAQEHQVSRHARFDHASLRGANPVMSPAAPRYPAVQSSSCRRE